jgi:hypothetical protein
MNKKIYLIAYFLFLIQLAYSQNLEQSNSKKHILTLSNENAVWNTVISGKAICQPCETSYGFAVLTDGKMITACSNNGTKLWEKGVPGKPNPYLTVFANDFLLTVSNEKNLTLINPSGLALWTKKVPFNITNNPYAGRDGRIFVRGKKNICCYGINGILKWQIETPELNKNIPMQELNDGTILCFLTETVQGKSKAIRFTPFGQILENITFSGLIVSAQTCSEGILLAFAGSGMGLCSIKENNVVTKWVVASEDAVFFQTSSNINSSFVVLKNNIACLLLPTQTNSKIVYFRISDGKIINTQIISELDLNKKTCIQKVPAVQGLFVSDNKTAMVIDSSGKIINQVYLPNNDKNKNWNYISYTNSNHIIVCGTNWVLNGFRTIQKLSSGSDKINKKTYNHFYKIDTSYYDTFTFVEKIDNSIADSARTKLLLNGKYATLEKDWTSIILSATTAYTNSLSQSFSSNRRIEKSLFSKDMPGTEILIKQLAILGTDNFSTVLSKLILNEKDTHLLLMLVSSIKYCAFDPNQTLINSLEKLLKATNSKNSALLMEICDSTYEICQFMGRPALYSHGMKMITQLLFPQYDSAVQNHARETLKKITQLKI